MACVAVAVLLGAGCRDEPACPADTSADPTRTAAVRSLVSTAPVETASLTVCWGAPRVSAISLEGVVSLEAARSDRDAAARLVHLASHHGVAEPLPGPGCVEAWVRREAAAYALELPLRAGLPPRYGFEDEVAAAPEARAAEVIERWLWEHPGGGEGVDALVEGYRRRCDR